MAESKSAQEAVLQLDAIPTAESTAARLLELAQDPESTVDAFADVIESDPGLAAELMRGASDPQREVLPVLDVRAAVRAAGRPTLERLAFAAVTPAPTGEQDPLVTSGLPELRRSAVATAVAARELAVAKDNFAPDEAYGAALLCALGPIAMAAYRPAQATALRRSLLAGDDVDRHEQERQLFGFDSDQMATALFEAWDFSLEQRDTHYFVPRSVEQIEHECPPQLLDVVGYVRAGAHVAGRAGFHAFGVDAEDAPTSDVRRLLEGVELDELTARVREGVERAEHAACPRNDEPEAFVRNLRVAIHELSHMLGASERKRQSADAVTSVMQYGLQRLGDGDPLPGLMYRTMEFMGFKRLSYLELDEETDRLEVRISTALQGSHKVPEGSATPFPAQQGAFPRATIVTRDGASAEATSLLNLLGVNACVLAPIADPAGMVAGYLAADRGLSGMPPVAGDERYLGIIADQASLLLHFERLSREQARMATIDPLTGAATRRKLMDRLENLISLSDRTQIPLSLAIMDLDHFKSFNDTMGHQVGDRLLQDLVKVLSANVRQTDLVARYGGEEFVVVFPDAKLDGASTVADKLREKVYEFGREHASEYDDLPISISIGVAQLRVDEHGEVAEDAMSLIGRADEVLYQAKHNGRNRVERAA